MFWTDQIRYDLIRSDTVRYDKIRSDPSSCAGGAPGVWSDPIRSDQMSFERKAHYHLVQPYFFGTAPVQFPF